MLPLIALRNLARNRRRTLLALLVVAAGTAGVLMTGGFIRYSFGGLSEALIQGGLGHLEVIPTGMIGASAAATDRLGQPPGLADWTDVQRLVEATPGVRAAGAVMQFSGMVTHDDRSTSFVGLANEPGRMTAMGVQTRLRGGTGLAAAAPAAGSDAAILGAGLAQALAVSPGDIVTVLVATPDGSMNALDLQVVGLFSTGLQDLDARVLQVHVASAQRLLDTTRVTSIVVGLEDARALPQVQAALARQFAAHVPSLSVLGWQERAPFYAQVRGLYLGIFVFLGAIVALLVTLSTANTLLMSLLERTREFAVLLAIGTTRGQLAGLVLLEALWVALLGSSLGCLLAAATAALLNALRIKMPPPPGAADPIDLALINVGVDYLWAIAFMLVVLAVAAVVPMVRLWRLRVLEGLAHV